RTFPHHPYFSLQLGPGQLSLYNLLKAYSLLDKEVGYCQGLSFLAGVLLLHMEENCAFEMLKHLLFHQGIRFQYKPDMVALQIQMYQLSRLIHDTYPDLYQHFENQEIAPTLYAAPWFLTMFASQFPLGFVARVFDLLFLDGMEVVFKVALVLLGNHKELIMQCTTFESVMEFLKTTLPSLGIIQMERVFNQVFTMDITRQLNAYEVEYHVLQEEMFTPLRSSSTDLDTVQRLETNNLTLKRENSKLQEQLDEAHATIHNLESLMATYQTNINHLETRVKELELDRLNLKKNVESLRHRIPEIDCCLSSEPELLICSGESSRSPKTHRRFHKSLINNDDTVDSNVLSLTGSSLMSNGSAKMSRGRLLTGEGSSSILSLTNSPIFE
uniref:Rab-GAP TBC domain-containing protein n=1 Tax=Strigamia maritima TaxID=126957 RepID=T1JI64_STRMM